MDNFLRYFFQDIGQFFRAFSDIFVALWHFLSYIFNIPERIKIIEGYTGSFSTFEWVMFLWVNIVF